MCQLERLEVALRVAGFWPRPEMVEERTVEEWREVVEEMADGLVGEGLVALAWVGAGLLVGGIADG